MQLNPFQHWNGDGIEPILLNHQNLRAVDRGSKLTQIINQNMKAAKFILLVSPICLIISSAFSQTITYGTLQNSTSSTALNLSSVFDSQYSFSVGSGSYIQSSSHSFCAGDASGILTDLGGYSNFILGNDNFIGGNGTQISGATLIGSWNFTDQTNSWILGRNNQGQQDTVTLGVAALQTSNAALLVGIDNPTKNGFEVLRNGNANFGGNLKINAANGIYFGTSTSPTISSTANGTAIFPRGISATGGLTLSGGNLSISTGTASNSSTTGALVVTGGIGVSADSWINGVRVGRGSGNIATNTVFGSNALTSNSSGYENTAIGSEALRFNAGGYHNVAIGSQALTANTSGSGNLALGSESLRYNLSGGENTAMGRSSLRSNTTGNSNTGVGANTLSANTSGGGNIAIGGYSLFANTTGNSNIGIGYEGLRYNVNGTGNLAIGGYAMQKNTSGWANVALGGDALSNNTTGGNNVAIGGSAGKLAANGTNLTDPESSIYIGSNSRGLSNSDNNSIVIGVNAMGQGANTTVIGNSNTTNTRIFGNLMVGDGTGSPVLTEAAAASSYLPLHPASILGSGANINNEGLLAIGQGAESNGYQTISLGSFSICSDTSSNSIALTGGQVTSTGCLATGCGSANGAGSIALGGMELEYPPVLGNRSDGANSVTVGGVGNLATGFSSFASGIWTKASSYGSIILGSLNLDSGSSPNTWVETDSLFELGNGYAPRNYEEPAPSSRSNAITTLKNGQTTLTNKAWKANPANPLEDPAATTTDSGGEALVVEGHTRLKGKVIIEQVQGDISMGIYQ